MSKLTLITDRALEHVLDLAAHAGDGLRHTRQTLHDKGSQAVRILNTGATWSMLRTGGKAATAVIKRNPAIAITTSAVVLGLLGYAAYRKRKQSQAMLLEGVIEHPIEELPFHLKRQEGLHSQHNGSQQHRLTHDHKEKSSIE